MMYKYKKYPQKKTKKTSSDYNKFAINILDAKIKENKFVDEYYVSGST